MTTRAENILANLVANRADELPDFDVLTIEGGGVRPDEVRTYRDLWDNGRRMARVMLDLGVQAGERIALIMANHAEFVEAMVASSIVGTVVVPIDPRTRGEKLHFMLKNVGCCGAFIADYALGQLQPLRDTLPEMRWVMGFATDEGSKPLAEYSGVVDWEAAAPVAVPEMEIRTTDPESALELIFTSGTTGDPKGIVMTHKRYCETSLLAMGLFGYRPEDRLYSGLSLTHANAQALTLGAALACRLRCVLSRRFTKSRLWDITRKYGATTFTLLGGMTTAVYAEPTRPNDADNPVRFVISAGMPGAIWEAFERRFGVQVLEFYGAAEGGLCFNYPGTGPVGSIGKPAPTLTYRVVDDDGREVPRGESGELIFRHADNAPFVVEYFDNPAASAKKCEGGWLHMGDVVHEDAEGWLYFDFRKGNGIRRNGEFINAAFVEKVIAESGWVDDVYVYGISGAHLSPGEKDVVAAVVPKNGSTFDIKQLFKTCANHLEPNIVPGFIQVLTHIPKTASEKPQDRFLIEAFESHPETVFRRETSAQ